ncbi:2-succinyl-5-enolpyruvyl-6-hydroxy-3-cyclohexene-1-carboxylic-acid synthase [Flavobacterium orientale]|uniref:2-succinyl-5-enolpyruvyl-6-hydroxy-3-cyclohexene-1-carboxylate synthase n=1 Tax=Flavobacterium orientale TaxID=1756020 RepID=A0A916Y2D0_9FLAO|nr:2-succinyl-5-enolpyruvyl-6-hydroxy-3-cyclohexene-1-carboxylic-acid synthase [Flavobacterium orientale]GGD26788.1 2-succinyl-5-enolpyruvyl-6-hydroxy-3-cyclohexene-1-carboxylate synthase [Flavobacterium orientale]
MKYPKIPLAQSLLEICEAKGIQHIVISPGSRNAPLTLGFTNNPFFTCYSIADERCAAFFALGIAQQINKPVVVVCTSGSAVLNFYPAVAEAFYSMIPLVVISADRPLDKVDIGDGQTIRQENVLANHTLYNANLTEIASEENDIKINAAFNTAMLKSGPTHINVPFEEPLYEVVDSLSVDSLILPLNKEEEIVSLEKILAAKAIWNTANKKLILVGTLPPNAIELQIVNHLANDPSVVVLTETTSNIHHPNFIPHIDTLITPFSDADFKAFQPDVLVTFGGMIVSKRIKSFLRSYQPEHHWHIDSLRAYNTFGCLKHHFKTTPQLFFEKFLVHVTYKESSYQQHFLAVLNDRLMKHELFLSKIDFCDLKVFELLATSFSDEIHLQISNSSAIRYAQLFKFNPSIPVFCNRGTSGIDGSTSTAIGAAVASQKPTVLITGDVSFFYDSNALWNNYMPKNFKIIVINNGGGGIFRILPGHEENDTFHTYFETSHCLTAENLAKMYCMKYTKASSIESLKQELTPFFANSEQPQILEVFTPTYDNDKLLKDYFKNVV